ncbi:transcriptional regulator [Paraburkholderia susongensis]|uniref:Transcriptional regulator n=2 Tax=Paraburkholderia susongensis TaxID=1515439 RepID=A0A1X7KMI6_9BURK|nr:transcriptional regulator [Paraburkholderia susongensis]
MGKAIVAYNPEFERAVLGSPLKRSTADTIVDPEALRDDFARTRERGYSLSIGEFSNDMVGIASPVYDRSGVATFGIGMWAPATLMTESRIKEIAPKLVLTAKAISAELGHFVRLGS